MPYPEPFSPEEREYYAGIKALLEERLGGQLPSSRQALAGLQAALEEYFKQEDVILSRRERFRLFRYFVDEILEDLWNGFMLRVP